MEKLTCKEVRAMMDMEWRRFLNYTVDEVKSYIRYNYECSRYAVNTLSHEFAGKR